MALAQNTYALCFRYFNSIILSLAQIMEQILSATIKGEAKNIFIIISAMQQQQQQWLWYSEIAIERSLANGNCLAASDRNVNENSQESLNR